MMNNKTMRNIIYIVSLFSTAVTIIALIFLPNLLQWYGSNILNSTIDKKILLLLYITGIPFLIILISVVKLSKALMKKRAFSKESLKELKLISICSCIDFLIFLGTIFVYKTVLCFVVMAAAFTVFMISFIVMELINNGIELQSEVDLTI